MDDENTRIINALKSPQFWVDYGKHVGQGMLDLVKTPGERLKGGDPTKGLSKEAAIENIPPAVGMGMLGPGLSAPTALARGGRMDPNTLAALYLQARDRYSEPNGQFGGSFNLIDDAGQQVGRTSLRYLPENKEVNVGNVASTKQVPKWAQQIGENNYAGWSVGPKDLKSLLFGLKREFPEAENISGFRVSGARSKAGTVDDNVNLMGNNLVRRLPQPPADEMAAYLANREKVLGPEKSHARENWDALMDLYRREPLESEGWWVYRDSLRSAQRQGHPPGAHGPAQGVYDYLYGLPR